MTRKGRGLHIREAREGDHNAIREVTLSAFQQYASLMPAHWEGYRERILTTLSDVKPAEQLVAEQEGAVVGTIPVISARRRFLFPEPPPGALVWPEARLLAVAPAARGQGIGVALVHECIRRARRSGAAVLTLHTTDMMHVAMAMYERIGFVRAPELDFHPSQDLTVKGYRLDLNNPPA